MNHSAGISPGIEGKMVAMSETEFVFFLIALGFGIFAVGFLVGNIAAIDTLSHSKEHIVLSEKLEIPIPEPPRPQVKGETIEGPMSADPPKSEPKG